MSRFDYLMGSSNNADPVMYSGNSNAVNLFGMNSAQITAVVTNASPGGKTFTADAASNVLTTTVNGYVTGLKVRVSNSGGALPSGLSPGVDYYWIAKTSASGYLATSYLNALANTPIDIGSNGTGTNTVGPPQLNGGVATLQSAQVDQNGAVIASTWKDVPDTAVDIDALGVFNFPILNVDFPAYRIAVTANLSGVLGLVITYSAD
jgi:hypothetical protein